MGLFDMFKKREEPSGPAAITADKTPGVVASPVSGRVIAMADVPDPVFSSCALGPGCAVWPEDDVVYAPVSGTITAAMGHAMGIQAEDGTEVLVHVGVDTVEMGGKGFTAHANEGSKVSAGQPLLTVDRTAVKAAGHPDCVVVAVTNGDDFSEVALAVAAEASVAAGAALLKLTR